MPTPRSPEPPPSPEAAQLAAELRGAAFPRVRYQRGYDRSDVDHLLRSVAERLEGGSASAELGREVSRSLFNATIVRSGYDERSVDEFLDGLAARLAQLLGPPPEPRPSLLTQLLSRVWSHLPRPHR